MTDDESIDPIADAIREDWPDDLDDDALIQVHGKKFHLYDEDNCERRTQNRNRKKGA